MQGVSRLGDATPPMAEVEGKVAFVTGGASGIGLGMVTAFLDAGMKVVIGDRDLEHLRQAMTAFAGRSESIHGVEVDVSDRESMKNAAAAVVEAFGCVHVVVNNAGIQNPRTLSETSYEQWDRMMRVNLDGVFNGIHIFLPIIKKQGHGGQIIATASMLGLFTLPGGVYGSYCASKFAVVAMMESLRAELAGSRIGVSVLCPGPVRSNLEESLAQNPTAIEPIDVGVRVLQAMISNEFYILTHPEFNRIINERTKSVCRSRFPHAKISPEREKVAEWVFGSSIYAGL